MRPLIYDSTYNTSVYKCTVCGSIIPNAECAESHGQRCRPVSTYKTKSWKYQQMTKITFPRPRIVLHKLPWNLSEKSLEKFLALGKPKYTRKPSALEWLKRKRDRFTTEEISERLRRSGEVGLMNMSQRYPRDRGFEKPKIPCSTVRIPEKEKVEARKKKMKAQRNSSSGELSSSDSDSEVESNHSESPYACPLTTCGVRLRDTVQLQSHFTSHLENNPWACPFPGCNVMLDTHSHFKRHVDWHKGARYFCCKKCGHTSSSTRAEFKKHLCFPQIPKPDLSKRSAKNFGEAYGFLKTHYESLEAKGLLFGESDERDIYFDFNYKINMSFVYKTDPVFLRVCKETPGFRNLIFGDEQLTTSSSESESYADIQREINRMLEMQTEDRDIGFAERLDSLLISLETEGHETSIRQSDRQSVSNDNGESSAYGNQHGNYNGNNNPDNRGFNEQPFRNEQPSTSATAAATATREFFLQNLFASMDAKDLAAHISTANVEVSESDSDSDSDIQEHFGKPNKSLEMQVETSDNDRSFTERINSLVMSLDTGRQKSDDGFRKVRFDKSLSNQNQNDSPGERSAKANAIEHENGDEQRQEQPTSTSTSARESFLQNLFASMDPKDLAAHITSTVDEGSSDTIQSSRESDSGSDSDDVEINDGESAPEVNGNRNRPPEYLNALMRGISSSSRYISDDERYEMINTFYESQCENYSDPEDIEEITAFTPGNPYACPLTRCRANLKDRNELKSHFIIHLKNNPYACPVTGCKVKLNTHGDFKNHVELHLGKNRICKAKCRQTFATEEKLKNHRCTLLRPLDLEKHRVMKEIIEAEHCLKKYYNALNRKGFLLQEDVVNLFDFDFPKIDIDSIMKIDPVLLNVCKSDPGFYDRIFGGEQQENSTSNNSQNRSASNKNVQEPPKSATKPNPDPGFYDGIFGTSTGNNSQSAQEMGAGASKPDKPYFCPFTNCGVRFTDVSHIKSHFIMHLENNPYACPFPGCNVKLNAYRHFKRHYDWHMGKPLICCEKCGSTCSSKIEFKYHDCFQQNPKPDVSKRFVGKNQEEILGYLKAHHVNLKARGFLEGDQPFDIDFKYVWKLDIDSIIQNDTVFIQVCKGNPDFREQLFGDKFVLQNFFASLDAKDLAARVRHEGQSFHSDSDTEDVPKESCAHQSQPDSPYACPPKRCPSPSGTQLERTSDPSEKNKIVSDVEDTAKPHSSKEVTAPSSPAMKRMYKSSNEGSVETPKPGAVDDFPEEAHSSTSGHSQQEINTTIETSENTNSTIEHVKCHDANKSVDNANPPTTHPAFLKKLKNGKYKCLKCKFTCKSEAVGNKHWLVKHNVTRISQNSTAISSSKNKQPLSRKRKLPKDPIPDTNVKAVKVEPELDLGLSIIVLKEEEIDCELDIKAEISTDHIKKEHNFVSADMLATANNGEQVGTSTENNDCHEADDHTEDKTSFVETLTATHSELSRSLDSNAPHVQEQASTSNDGNIQATIENASPTTAVKRTIYSANLNHAFMKLNNGNFKCVDCNYEKEYEQSVKRHWFICHNPWARESDSDISPFEMVGEEKKTRSSKKTTKRVNKLKKRTVKVTKAKGKKKGSSSSKLSNGSDPLNKMKKASTVAPFAKEKHYHNNDSTFTLKSSTKTSNSRKRKLPKDPIPETNVKAVKVEPELDLGLAIIVPKHEVDLDIKVEIKEEDHDTVTAATDESRINDTTNTDHHIHVKLEPM